KKKIKDNKIKNQIKIEDGKGSRRGLWYLTFGHFPVNINYEFISKYRTNNFNINYSGYDSWDFDLLDTPDNPDIIEKLYIL
ncbi:hypothetical protein H8356DRAFT_935181, partial [Neocallimastix lanati (nom. inval.)]